MNKFNEVIKIADIHATRINQAIDKIGHLFPMPEHSVKSMDEQSMLWTDLLVNRFGKLQDLIGSKIIDLFFEQAGDNIDGLTTIDKLHKLEKLNIINDANIWKTMRRVRNYVAHEYPDHPEIMAQHLNQIFTLTPKLLHIYERIKNSADFA